MELALISILGALGYSYTNKYVPAAKKSSDLNDNVLGRETPNATHPYHSNYLKQAELKELENNVMNQVKSQTPYATGYLNGYSPLNFETTVHKMYGKESEAALAGPMFKKPEFKKDSVIGEQFNGEISKLSGLPMDYTHNNMQKWSSKNYAGNPFSDGTHQQSRLDQFTGSKGLKWNSEKPTAPMFAPVATRLPAAPSFTQLVDTDRYNPGKYITGVLPFEQIAVSYIPQQLIDLRQETVDDLRSKMHPKMVHKGNINPGQKPGQQAKAGDYFKKEKKQKVFELGIDRSVPRNNNVPATPNDTTGLVGKGLADNKFYNEAQFGNFATSNKAFSLPVSDQFNTIPGYKNDYINTAPVALRNARQKYGSNDDYNIGNVYIKDQERDTTTNQYWLAGAGATNRGVMQNNYTADTTTKETTLITDTFGGARNPVNGGAYRDSEHRLEDNTALVEGYIFGGGRDHGRSGRQQVNKLRNGAITDGYFSGARATDSLNNFGSIGRVNLKSGAEDYNFLGRGTQKFKVAPLKRGL